MMKYLLLLTVTFSPIFSMNKSMNKNKIKETTHLTKVIINSDGNSSDLDNFDNKSRCSICFERYNDGESKQRVDIPCDPERKIYHRYCRPCITDWVKKNESCPTCKRSIKLKDLSDSNYFSSIIACLQKLCCCE